MNILVCVKQIVEPDKIEYDEKTNNIIRKPSNMINNPSDLNALEFALSIKDRLKDVSITTLSMGALFCKDNLKELIEVGADRCILLSDKRLAGSDASATSFALACAIKKLGSFDLILCGEFSLDGETSIVPPQIAEHLNLSHVGSVFDISVDDGNIMIKKKIDQGYVVYKLTKPAVLSIVKDSNRLRFPKLSYMLRAIDYEPDILSLDDIGIKSTENIGMSGSKTVVERFEKIQQNMECNIYYSGDENGFECLVDTIITNLG